jgi:hypothetical protein
MASRSYASIAFRIAPGSASNLVHGVQAADIADGSVTIVVRLIDGAAQLAELVGLAEHPALSPFF